MRKFLWDRVFRLAMTDILLFLTIVMVIPLVPMLALSFSSRTASNMNAVNLLPVGSTLDSWGYILLNEDVWRAFFITVTATASGVMLSLAITSLFAYSLSKEEFKASKLLMTVALITMVFKTPMVPYFSTLKNIELLNNPLVLMLPQILTAYNMIIMRGFSQQFLKEVGEAAVIDGTSRFRVFCQIVLPSSKAVLATTGLFYGVTLWNQFQRPIMFIQDMKLFPFQMEIHQLIGSRSKLRNVAASISVNYSGRTLQAIAVVFAILPIITVYPFIQKYFTRGTMFGSAKG